MTKLLMCVLAFMTAGQGSPVRPEQEDCAPAQPSRVWSTIVPASVKTRVEPTWPYLQNFDAHGIIILDVWIDETGEVACIKVIRPVPVFDRAAVEAVHQWKFTPATHGGRPIAVVQTISILKPPDSAPRGQR